MRLSLCCCMFVNNDDLDRMTVEDKREAKVFVSYAKSTSGCYIVRFSSCVIAHFYEKKQPSGTDIAKKSFAPSSKRWTSGSSVLFFGYVFLLFLTALIYFSLLSSVEIKRKCPGTKSIFISCQYFLECFSSGECCLFSKLLCS